MKKKEDIKNIYIKKKTIGDETKREGKLSGDFCFVQSFLFT